MHQSISPCIQTLGDILNGIEPGENAVGFAGNARVWFALRAFFVLPFSRSRQFRLALRHPDFSLRMIHQKPPEFNVIICVFCNGSRPYVTG